MLFASLHSSCHHGYFYFITLSAALAVSNALPSDEAHQYHLGGPHSNSDVASKAPFPATFSTRSLPLLHRRRNQFSYPSFSSQQAGSGMYPNVSQESNSHLKAHFVPNVKLTPRLTDLHNPQPEVHSSQNSSLRLPVGSLGTRIAAGHGPSLSIRRKRGIATASTTRASALATTSAYSSSLSSMPTSATSWTTAASAAKDGQVTLRPSDAVTPNETIRCRGALFCVNAPYSQGILRIFSNAKFIDDKHETAHVVDGSEASADGTFELWGEHAALDGAFRPALAIYHQCGQLKRKNTTHQRVIIKIPAKYVNSNETFDIGKLNLILHYPGQKDGLKVQHFSKPMKVSGKMFCKSNPKAARIVKMFASEKTGDEGMVGDVTLQDGSEAFSLESARAAKLDKPIIQIQHQCDLPQDKIDKDLYRQFVVHIPFFYYNPGRLGLKALALGRYNLAIIYPGERTVHVEAARK